MNFVRDDFESVHRRKRLAAWLRTLKGPEKQRPALPNYDALNDLAQAFNQRGLNQSPYGYGLGSHCQNYCQHHYAGFSQCLGWWGRA